MSEHAFEPEVVALLDEIARSSGPNLLRTPKERLLKWVGRPEEVISPHGSYLSKAERHLVTAYREQAAAVLHAACIERLTRPGSFVFLESSRRPDLSQVDLRASRIARGGSTQLPGGAGFCEFVLRYREVNATQLAAASLRLVPSDLTRIALGLAYQTDGHSSAAIRVFGQVIAGKPTSIMRSLANDNRGFVHGSNGEYSRALECYIEATRPAHGLWKSLIWRMCYALQLGEGAEAVRSAHELGAMDVKSQWLDEIVQVLDEKRKAKRWAPTPRAQKQVSELRDNMPEAARRVCDAIHPMDA